MKKPIIIEEELGVIECYVNRIEGLAMIHLSNSLSNKEKHVYAQKGSILLQNRKDDFILEFIGA